MNSIVRDITEFDTLYIQYCQEKLIKKNLVEEEDGEWIDPIEEKNTPLNTFNIVKRNVLYLTEELIWSLTKINIEDLRSKLIEKSILIEYFKWMKNIKPECEKQDEELNEIKIITLN